MALQVRRYRADDDLGGVVRIFTDSVHMLAPPFYDEVQRAAWAPENADIDEWRERLEGMNVLVAEDEGGLCGFLGYEPNGHVALLYTASRAARRGVASKLYARVEDEWIAAGIRRVFAEVSLAARAFFERQGFVVVVEERVERRGATFTRFAMEKRLAPASADPEGSPRGVSQARRR
jgi:putative acetyltransferase